MDIVVNVNIGSEGQSVDVKKKIVKKPMKNGKGGIIQFPEAQGADGEAILDFMGIKEV